MYFIYLILHIFTYIYKYVHIDLGRKCLLAVHMQRKRRKMKKSGGKVSQKLQGRAACQRDGIIKEKGCLQQKGKC